MRYAIEIPMKPIGMFMRKIQCQLKLSERKPPKLGPATIPNNPNKVIKFIVLSS
jgi:hypothetical protein